MLDCSVHAASSVKVATANVANNLFGTHLELFQTCKPFGEVGVATTIFNSPALHYDGRFADVCSIYSAPNRRADVFRWLVLLARCADDADVRPVDPYPSLPVSFVVFVFSPFCFFLFLN